MTAACPERPARPAKPHDPLVKQFGGALWQKVNFVGWMGWLPGALEQHGYELLEQVHLDFVAGMEGRKLDDPLIELTRLQGMAAKAAADA